MRGLKEKIIAVFFSDTWLGALLWFAAALAMVSLLVWFLVFSDFGAPAAPVYENF